MNLAKAIALAWKGTVFWLASLLAAATVISLVKRAYGVELYGSPQVAYDYYEWARNNIFDFLYWMFLGWWRSFSLPDLLEDFMTLYLAIGFAKRRGIQLNFAIAPERSKVMEDFFEMRKSQAPKLSLKQRLRRRLLSLWWPLRRVLLWPKSLWFQLRRWNFAQTEPRQETVFDDEANTALPEEYYTETQISIRYHILSFLIMLFVMSGAAMLFFYWNEIERLSGQ